MMGWKRVTGGCDGMGEGVMGYRRVWCMEEDVVRWRRLGCDGGGC